MKAPKTDSKTFEKLVVDEWINGTIKDIQYDLEKKWTWQGEESIKPGVRLVFEVEGYSYPHYSGWLKFNVSEKSNLYKRYISALVKDAKPDMDVDIDILKGMKVRMIWEENENGFQRVLKIKPVKDKVVAKDNEPTPPDEDDFIPEIDEDDVPL
jgi:hypothetical protein